MHNLKLQQVFHFSFDVGAKGMGATARPEAPTVTT